MKKRLNIVIISIIILLAIASLYLIFYQKPNCNTIECFQDHMKSCTPASYINEEPEASWGYKIQGSSNNDCNIKVTLLQAKEGELGLQDLEKFSMTCQYSKGIFAYPEKNLEVCSGKLKEELQGVIIEKLHVYIIENLGELDEALKSI